MKSIHGRINNLNTSKFISFFDDNERINKINYTFFL